MKLAASMFCVAALSLAACAEETSVGGGQGEGILPSKIAFVRPEQVQRSFDPADVTNFKQKLGSSSADAVCEGCVMTTYAVVDTSAGIDEVRLVSDGGAPVCRIFLDQDTIVIDECGWSRP